MQAVQLHVKHLSYARVCARARLRGLRSRCQRIPAAQWRGEKAALRLTNAAEQLCGALLAAVDPVAVVSRSDGSRSRGVAPAVRLPAPFSGGSLGVRGYSFYPRRRGHRLQGSV